MSSSQNHSKTNPPQNWVVLTKRTNDPKLGWLETTLAKSGIQSRRNGQSFHAPILEVLEANSKQAQQILDPIDDIDDDDPRFLLPFDIHPSGRSPFGWHL